MLHTGPITWSLIIFSANIIALKRHTYRHCHAIDEVGRVYPNANVTGKRGNVELNNSHRAGIEPGASRFKIQHSTELATEISQ